MTACVTCVRCKTEYTNVIGSNASNIPNQAYDCACDIHGDTVYGAYGSSVLDMEVAHFRDGEDHGFLNGQICDSCLTFLIEQGHLIRENEDED